MPLRHAPFLFCVGARGLSEFAAQIFAVAVGWHIYALTGSPFNLGFAGLGAFESGTLAGFVGAMPATLTGGVGTILVALLWMRLFPTLRDVERLDADTAPR